MKLEAVKQFYNLLGHKKQTEIRAFKLSKDFKKVIQKKQFFVSSEEEFLDKIKELNGQYNLYAGLNERTDKGTEAKDVISVNKIFLDIDCINKPAIEEDIFEAEKITNEIISKIEEKTGLRATKIYSGNGYQIIYSIPEIRITEENRDKVQTQIQEFIRQLIDKYSNSKVKLDNVGDLPRIIRITGTTNIKGNKISEFLEINKEENSKLKDYILNLKPDFSANIKLKDKKLEAELNERFYQILEKDEKIKKLYEGNFEGYDLSIGGELALLCYLIQYNFDKKEIFNIMASSKIGRWAEKGIRYREETYKKALAKINKEKQDKTKYLQIKLSELNANLINKFVSVDCQITGEQIQKAIPESIEVSCDTCGKRKVFNSLDNPEPFISDREMKTILNEFKNRFMCSCAFDEEKTPIKTVEIKNYIDYSVLFVRDLLDRESLTAIKRYEAKKVYVINQNLPNAKTVNLKGKVFIEPKNKNISIICDNIQHLENQIEDFKITEEFKDNSRRYFNSENDLYKEINPDIVGKQRDIAKQSLIFQLHSPCKIYDITRKKLIRGGLNIIFYGDTKCGKSEISKDITQKGSMPLAEYTICETGGRTGFLYTIDRDKGSLIWGSLALNDLGLVILDGLQSMHSEELGEFREAIEQQEIIVRRSISGEALARTRILGSLNPNKPMVNYIYKCQGLQDTYVFSKSPEVTRWDLFIPFSLKDVSGKEIAHRKAEEKPIPEDIFVKHIYWVWSRKPEQIIYTESAVNKINDMSEQFIDNYSLETLPIVHNGVRDIITRLSVSMACQMHSTEETHEKVIVETEHVQRAVNWYKQVLDMLELARYKQDTEGKSELTDNDCIAISKELGKTEFDILEEIKHEGKSSSQLAEILELVPKTIKEHYKPLQKHGLIEASTGKGIFLSVKGVKFVRWCMLGTGNIVTNDVTKKMSGNKKSYYLTRQNEGIEKYCIGENQEEIDFSELDKEFENE